ncbi:MFS transporter [Rugosimonospora africana]|uniref:MFS transporter n=1 Tax=Rugosimonospora africana TaxID=556532 RepID=A0A8J3QSI9_9ACTN|nr:MFS transporter [Rugosimonospora africana]GIH15661.1 MFS transporter [Rugosimonospora africana]
MVRGVLNLTPYRRVLAVPGLRGLLLVSVLARVPMAATAVALTLHVVTDLGRGYAQAGLVGTAMTVGTALGSPVLGRVVDRRGLRPVLAVTTVTTALFWTVAPILPYPLLLVTAFAGGLLILPVYSVVRQSIAALVPEDQRRQAYAMDSMSVELAFMCGPALAVLISTSVSPRVTLLGIGAGMALAGVALIVLDPPTRVPTDPRTPGVRVPRRSWLTLRLIAILLGASAATLVLSGADVSVVAVLRAHGEVGWSAAVLGLWSVYSLAGGFAYGGLSRPLPPLALTVVLGLLTAPVGLGGGRWWLLALALLPAGALCAPTLAATADAVSRLVPGSVRGEAMGLHGSALTVGLSLGSPLAGTVIDATVPAGGFAAAGLLGALAAALVLPLELRRRRRDRAASDPVVLAEANAGG